MQRRRSQRGFLTLLFLALGGSALADQPPVVDCPWLSTASASNVFGRLGFYLKSYPGTSLKQVTLYIAFPGAGAYSLALQARSGTFSTGTSLGRATVSLNVSASTLGYQPVTFDFGTVAVPQDSTLTFETQTVSKPADVGGNRPVFQIMTSETCPVIETYGFNPPLDKFRANGVAVRITGDEPATFNRTITIPAVASVHGVNNSFFHSDVWLVNGTTETKNVTARYRCFNGQNCGSATASFVMPAGSGKTIPDIAGTLFGAPGTAGALELSYQTKYKTDTLVALSRVYTPSLPAPTNGAAVPALGPYAATGHAGFPGLGNNGGDRSAGFRSNVGVYNNNDIAVDVSFRLFQPVGTSVRQIGQTVTQSWGPFESRQINDIFAAVGGGAEVTTDAFLDVESALAVLPYVTVIDNQTGDSIFLGPTDFAFDPAD